MATIWDKAKQTTPGGFAPFGTGIQQSIQPTTADGTYGAGLGVLAPSYYEEPAPTYQDPYAGSGAYAAAPMPSRLLAESPEWLAYLNALGVQEQGLRAETDKMRGLYQSDAARQLQDLPAGYISQRRGITGQMESRGMARSGEMLRRLAENRAQQGRAEAGVNAQLGFQLGSLESSLAQKLIEMNTQRAAQEASMRAQGYV